MSAVGQPVAAPAHGGTDAGPAVRHDFSTNANALGPDPALLSAVRDVDPTAYPDPDYARVRARLGRWHDRDPAEVVVGAGACELIHRAVRTTGGPVALLASTFGEYGYAAQLAGAQVRSAHDTAALMRLLPGAALAVLCVPNTPDGATPDVAGVAAAAARAGCALLLDLAYRPLAQVRPALPPWAWQLWAPNKAHALTGLRAAYLLAPAADAARLRPAPSWVLSAHGVAFLAAVATPQAQRWVTTSRPLLWHWRDRLATRLRDAGVAVTTGDANFLLGDVGDATAVTAHLRAHGIRVRDATSFGLPHALRLSAQPPAAQDALLRALQEPRERPEPPA